MRGLLLQPKHPTYCFSPRQLTAFLHATRPSLDQASVCAFIFPSMYGSMPPNC